MSAFFITGSGTGVGKTFVTCTLIRQLRALGRDVHAIKPIISGYVAEGSDTQLIAQALGLPWSDATAESLSPWRFSAPLSPHLAAEKEGVTLESDALLAFCRNASGDPLLIEGAGGVMTPVNHEMTHADLIIALRIPALLVSGSYLGAINHTLAAAECLTHRNIPLAGIIVSASAEDSVSLEDTTRSLRSFLPSPVPILALPRQMQNASMNIDIPDLTQVIK